jgi:phage tail-like protein
MARSASVDPIERFRFQVSVLSIDLSITAAVDALAVLNKNLGILTRAGFSEITLPKVTINELTYRENIDNQRFSKGPGLAKYEPIVLRRGSTNNRDLFNWYRLVNDDSLLLSSAQELIGQSIIPSQSENFRKEVVISALDREGNETKQWLLFNAWPSAYKGGNDFDAKAEEKLIEEMTLSYESFLELKGGIGGVITDLVEDVAQGTILTGLDAANAKFNIPFTR